MSTGNFYVDAECNELNLENRYLALQRIFHPGWRGLHEPAQLGLRIAPSFLSFATQYCDS